VYTSLYTIAYSPYARVEDVCEDGDSDPRPGARKDLDELPLPLKVLAQHEGRCLSDHRVAHAEQDAVTERKKERRKETVKPFKGGNKVHLYEIHEKFQLEAAKIIGI
jgi:hypothetical protein